MTCRLMFSNYAQGRCLIEKERPGSRDNPFYLLEMVRMVRSGVVTSCVYYIGVVH